MQSTVKNSLVYLYYNYISLIFFDKKSCAHCGINQFKCIIVTCMASENTVTILRNKVTIYKTTFHSTACMHVASIHLFTHQSPN